MRGRIVGVLLALCLCATGVPARAAITAALSDSQIAAGTTVQLTLTYAGLTTSEPDLEPLRRDFEILGRSSSTSVQLGTGGSSETSQVVLTLAPKRTGALTVPPLSWDGEHSPPLALQVTRATAGASAPHGSTAQTPVFIVSRVTPAQPYVQAQVRLTVQIYAAEPLYHGTLDFSGNGAILVKQIGTDQYGSALRAGRTYQVITRRYVLFPLHSGRIQLPGPLLDADVAAPQRAPAWSGNPFSGFFGGLLRTLRPIETRGDPIVLSVRPRPAGAAGRNWLPASHLALSAQWTPQSLRAHAGDPLTVTLNLQATGLTSAQLPDLSRRLAPPEGLRAYPDQAKLADTVQGRSLVGSRDQTIAFIARRPGRYVLPAVTLRWWNTRANLPEVATLPSRTLLILPAPATTPTAAVSASAAAGATSRAAPPPARASRRAPSRLVSQRTLWPWLSAALAALWLATVGAWLWSRRGRPRPHAAATAQRPGRRDAKTEQNAFQDACTRNDARAARRHLLNWLAAAWGVPATSLGPLAAVNRDPLLEGQLRELEQACYGGGDWQGAPLAETLRELPARCGAAEKRDETLPPLYP